MSGESILPPVSPVSNNAGMVGAVTGAAEGIFDRIYNVFTGERARKDNLKQIEINRQREDTAVQRRMADLKAAGLHPTLAAGSAAQSATAPSISQPQQSTRPGIMQSALNGAQLEAIQAQVALTRAEADRVREQTRLMDPDYQIRRQQMDLNQLIGNQQVSKLAEEISEIYYRNSVSSGAGVIDARKHIQIVQSRMMDVAYKMAQLDYKSESELYKATEAEVRMTLKDEHNYDARFIAEMAGAITGSVRNVAGSIPNFRKSVRNSTYNTYIPLGGIK